MTTMMQLMLFMMRMVMMMLLMMNDVDYVDDDDDDDDDETLLLLMMMIMILILMMMMMMMLLLLMMVMTRTALIPAILCCSIVIFSFICLQVLCFIESRNNMSMSGSSSSKELVETSHTYHYQVGFSNHRPNMSNFPFLHDVQDQPHPTTSSPFHDKFSRHYPSSQSWFKTTTPIVFFGGSPSRGKRKNTTTKHMLLSLAPLCLKDFS